MSRIQRRIYVSGKVQGVGFRASTVLAASKFAELRGFVRNLDDGRVEAVFSGPEKSVLAMVSWCGHGPPSARVNRIEVLDEPVDENLGSFSQQS